MPAAVPLIVAGVSAASSIYAQKKAADRQKKDREQAMGQLDPNSYAEGDPLRDFLSGKTYDTTNTNSSSGTYGSNTHSVNTTNPFLTKEYGPLGDLMRGMVEGRLKSGGLPAGFEQKGIRAINDTNEGINTSIADKLTSSGLLGGPAEANLTSIAENSRGRGIADFRSNLPLVQRQLQTEDLNLASMLTNLFGKGTKSVSDSSTSGWQNSMGSSTTSGGVPPGLMARVGQPYYPTPPSAGESIFSNMPQLLMFLQGSGIFNKKGGGGGGGGDGFNFGPAGPPPQGTGGQY